MKHRSVVANFLFKNDESGQPVVALFRRSHHPDVHTYRGKLAPISGSIDALDADSYAAAVRELHEETRLVVNQDYELRFCGTPFSFIDDEAQRSWTVNPFGWNVTSDEKRIKLDWEHSGWQWVQPGKILDGSITDECVPRLDHSFRRVYFGVGGIFGANPFITRDTKAGKVFMSGLASLRNDKENGARVIANKALRCLINIVKSMDRFDWRSVKIAGYHLIHSGRPSMSAAISSAVLTALRDINPSTTSTTNESEVIEVLDRCLTSRENASNEICRSFATFIRNQCRKNQEVTIATLSSSSTIRFALTHLLETRLDLRIKLKVLESRPLCEGASMAAAILSDAVKSNAASRLSVQIAPDSHVAHFASSLTSPSFLVLGADRISTSGHVSNKTGSCAAAIVTKTLSPTTQVVVLSETDKIAKPSDLEAYEKGKEEANREMQEHSPETNDVAEVTRIWGAAGVSQSATNTLETTGREDIVDVQNVYFEWMPRRFIDVYVCEKGEMNQRNIRAISLEKGRTEKQMFAELYD